MWHRTLITYLPWRWKSSKLIHDDRSTSDALDASVDSPTLLGSARSLESAMRSDAFNAMRSRPAGRLNPSSCLRNSSERSHALRLSCSHRIGCLSSAKRVVFIVACNECNKNDPTDHQLSMWVPPMQLSYLHQSVPQVHKSTSNCSCLLFTTLQLLCGKA